MEATETRYCRDCLYELTGVEAVREFDEAQFNSESEEGELVHRCPECGRRFDPADLSTTRPRPRSFWKWAAQSRVVRSAALLAVLLVLFYFTILPRPATGDWTRWEWLGRAYGVETTWTALGQVRRSYWADRLTSITTNGWNGDRPLTVKAVGDGLRLTVDSAGVGWRDIAWAVAQFENRGPDLRYDARAEGESTAPFATQGPADQVMWEAMRLCGVRPDFTLTRAHADTPWRLEVRDPQIGWGPIVTAFNSLRDTRYGVRIQSVAADADAPDRIEPFTVEGTEADIFWAIVTTYGLQLDAPERVPARSDGWHPSRPSQVAPRPGPTPRGGVAPAGAAAFR